VVTVTCASTLRSARLNIARAVSRFFIFIFASNVLESLIALSLGGLWQQTQAVILRRANGIVRIRGYGAVPRHCSQSIPSRSSRTESRLDFVSFALDCQPLKHDLVLAIHSLSLGGELEF